MKTRILSLTVLLLAGAASGALAQDRDGRDRDRAPPENGGIMQRVLRETQPPHYGPQAPPAPAAPQAPPQPHRGQPPPQAQPAPAAPQAARGYDRDGERWRPQAGGPGPRPPRAVEQDRRVDERRDDDRRDWRARDGGWDQRGWDRRDDDRRPDGGRDGPRRPGGGRDYDRDHDRDDRDRDGRDRPRWELHRYPPIYSSPSRYRAPGWRPPYGYYARSWRFGEIVPRGWYEPDYRILDWWAYGLPEPPYGYDWIRMGPDALLVDLYSGRVVQVVRLVFW